MSPYSFAQQKKVVILRLSDEDSRRTSTSTPSTKSIRTILAIGGSGLLIAAICYPFSSERLLITDY